MLLNVVAGDVDAPGFAERLARKGKRLRGLEQRGWVEETGDGSWILTDEGRAAKERLGAIVDGMRSRVGGAVSPEDFATTVASLEAIARELGWDENERMPWTGFGRGSGRGFGRGFGPGLPAGLRHRAHSVDDIHHGFGPNLHGLPSRVRSGTAAPRRRCPIDEHCGTPATRPPRRTATDGDHGHHGHTGTATAAAPRSAPRASARTSAASTPASHAVARRDTPLPASEPPLLDLVRGGAAP